jgi:hypothetical protein
MAHLPTLYERLRLKQYYICWYRGYHFTTSHGTPKCVEVSTSRRWVRQFKDGELGQADLSDKTRSGRPATASDQLHQDRVEKLIRGNRRVKQKEIAIAL